MNIPFVKFIVSAGFPSPAEDFLEPTLDLNKYLIHNPPATFCVKVNGNSMKGERINSGDILIVDRSLEPKNNTIVLAVLDGEFTVKRIQKRGSQLFLKPENETFKPIEITEEIDFKVWGVVTHIIHKV